MQVTDCCNTSLKEGELFPLRRGEPQQPQKSYMDLCYKEVVQIQAAQEQG